MRKLVIFILVICLCCGCTRKQTEDKNITNEQVIKNSVKETQEIVNLGTESQAIEEQGTEPIDTVYLGIEEFPEGTKHTNTVGEASFDVTIGRLEGYFNEGAIGELFVEAYIASAGGWETVLLDDILITDFTDGIYAYTDRQQSHPAKTINVQIPKTPCYGKIMITLYASSKEEQDGEHKRLGAAAYDELCFVSDEAIGTMLINGSQFRQCFLDSRAQLYKEGKLSSDEYDLFVKDSDLVLLQMQQNQLELDNEFSTNFEHDQIQEVIMLTSDVKQQDRLGYELTVMSGQESEQLFLEGYSLKEAFCYSVWDHGYYGKKKGLFFLNVVCNNQPKTYVVQYQEGTLKMLAALNGWFWNMCQSQEDQLTISVKNPDQENSTETECMKDYYLEDEIVSTNPKIN